MIKKLHKSNFKRNTYKNSEISLKILTHFTKKNQTTKKNISLNLTKNNKLPSISKSQLLTICSYTYRAKATFPKLTMSRLTFRELASNGLLNGFKKYTW